MLISCAPVSIYIYIYIYNLYVGPAMHSTLGENETDNLFRCTEDESLAWAGKRSQYSAFQKILIGVVQRIISLQVVSKNSND